MAFPLISVIVPIYKTEPYIARCLQSICTQTYRELEIICVDDGSPDHSTKILENFSAQDPRIRIIQQSNQGLAAARNAALSAAKGEWVAFVDSDDWIEADTYACCISHIKDDIDMVVFGVSIDNELPADAPQWEEMENECNNLKECCRIKHDGSTILSDEVIMDLNVSVWNKLYRRSVLEKHHIAFPPGRWYEDVSFSLRFFLLSHKGYFIQHSPFYHYIQRRESIMFETRRLTPRILDHFDIIRDVYTTMKRIGNIRTTLLAHFTDRYLGIMYRYAPKELYTVIDEEGRKLIHEVGIERYTEFEFISKLTGNSIHQLRRLFYRRRGLKREFGFLGCMVLSIQHKKGVKIIRFLGIPLWRKTDR